MAPYPSAYEIEDIFKYRESPETMHLWDERLAPNLSGRVMGHDHHLSGELNGIDAWKKGHTANLTEMLDTSKGYSLEVVNVVGGGESPWAAVETVTSGKAKSGSSLSLSLSLSLQLSYTH